MSEFDGLSYCGVVYNQVTGQLWRTNRYSTYKNAHDKAEELAKRVSIYTNCSLNVETYDEHGQVVAV